MTEFEKIWERDGRWIGGPDLLGKVVVFLRDKSVFAKRDEIDKSRLNIEIPLPEVRNEIDGRMVPIFLMVPEELQEIFMAKCHEVLLTRKPDVEEICHHFLCMPVTELTIYSINSELAAKERNRRAAGGDDLSVEAAKAFGIFPGHMKITLSLRPEQFAKTTNNP